MAEKFLNGTEDVRQANWWKQITPLVFAVVLTACTPTHHTSDYATEAHQTMERERKTLHDQLSTIKTYDQAAYQEWLDDVEYAGNIEVLIEQVATSPQLVLSPHAEIQRIIKKESSQ